MHKKVAIIGGGPVGLATARLLQLRGVEVNVYERDADKNSRVSGGTLDIHRETGQKTLKAAGLLGAIFTNSRPTGMTVTDIQGKLLIRMKPDKTKPEIDRPVLRKILLESLKPDTVRWHTHITDICAEKNGYSIVENGRAIDLADIVLIADGGRSKARSCITQQSPEETGTFVIQGEIDNYKTKCPNLFKFTGTTNLTCVQDKKTIFCQTRGDGSLCFYVSFRKSEQWLSGHQFDFGDKKAVDNFLFKLIEGWHPMFHELFEAASEYIGFSLRVFHVGYKKNENFQNVTLIGDAAHVMTPFGGMGVNMGLRDALLLVENLTSQDFSDAASAILDYEKQMMAYAKPIQTFTSQADDRIHHSIENSVSGMRLRIINNLLRVINWAAIIFMFLAVGVFWGFWLSLTRSYHLLTLSELIHVGQIAVSNLAVPMRIISVIAVLLMGTSAYLHPDKNTRWFYFKLIGIACFIIPLVLTVAFEMPINNQVIRWTYDTAPPYWETLRNKWQLINIFRVAFALLGFALFSTAVIKPFHRDFIF